MGAKKSATVLIVGDDPNISGKVAKQKSLSGCRSILASNVEEAIKVAAKQPEIDILLTDITQPDCSNEVDLTTQFHKLYPKTRILYIIP